MTRETDHESYFEMMKRIEVKQDWIKEAKEAGLSFVPFKVVDGDEKATGSGEIEIDFSKVSSREDVALNCDVDEVELFDSKDGEAVYWIPISDLVDREEIVVYYNKSGDSK